jgi:HSP20 family protein
LVEDEDWGFASNIPSGLSLSEDEKKVYAEAALPGVDPKDVDITCAKGVVKITGASSQEEKQGRKIWKRSQSEFSYQFSIPADVDTNKDPEAEIKNGILYLTFAKSPQATPRKISIKSK